MRALSKLMLILTCVSWGLPQAPDKTKVFLSSDKKTQITVPSTWQALKLQETAEIQVGSEAEACFIMVLNEAKEDMYGMNLDKHSRVTLGQMLAAIDFPSVTGPNTLTVNGRPALQYEIRGVAEGQNVVWFHATVEGPKYFSQIIAWTLPSKLEAAKPKLLAALATFRETDSAK